MPRVYIGRLSYNVREKDIQRFFSGYGRLLEIDLKNAGWSDPEARVRPQRLEPAAAGAHLREKTVRPRRRVAGPPRWRRREARAGGTPGDQEGARPCAPSGP